MTKELTQNSASSELKKFWEKNWSRTDYFPSWKITELPQAIKEAIESNWFPPGSSILDIGCGSGEISALLAQLNFKVLGIDFAESAIKKAKLAHGEIEGKLQFKTLDICQYHPEKPQFNVLIDRCCFDGIPKKLHLDYGEKVASWAISGARFLLLCSTNKGTKTELIQEKKLQEQMIKSIEKTFFSIDLIIKIVETVIEKKPVSVPALAVWMIRK